MAGHESFFNHFLRRQTCWLLLGDLSARKGDFYAVQIAFTTGGQQSRCEPHLLRTRPDWANCVWSRCARIYSLQIGYLDSDHMLMPGVNEVKVFHYFLCNDPSFSYYVTVEHQPKMAALEIRPGSLVMTDWWGFCRGSTSICFLILTFGQKLWVGKQAVAMTQKTIEGLDIPPGLETRQDPSKWGGECGWGERWRVWGTGQS